MTSTLSTSGMPISPTASRPDLPVNRSSDLALCSMAGTSKFASLSHALIATATLAEYIRSLGAEVEEVDLDEDEDENDDAEPDEDGLITSKVGHVQVKRYKVLT